jgi:hypothetical protein
MAAAAKQTLVGKIAAASLTVGGKLQADKRHDQQRYDYVSTDAILASCGQALAEQGVAVFPTIVQEHVDAIEYETPKGLKTRYDARIEFGFIVSDGETEMTFPWIGRGVDYGVPDKATYKAMTSGHGYFLRKLLNVGAGNEDGEHDTPQEGRQVSKSRKNGTTQSNMISDRQRKALHAMGKDLYGDGWEDKRHELVKSITAGRTESSTELTSAQAKTLIDGMGKKLAERNEPPDDGDDWLPPEERHPESDHYAPENA